MATLAEEAKRLRQRFAVNQLKLRLLGSGHEAGAPQTREVISALEGIAEEGDVIDPRTWESWFSVNPRIAHASTIRRLDRVVRKINEGDDDSRSVGAGGPDAFRRLIEGGLLFELQQPTRSKRPQYVLIERAGDYVPPSAWHLHLDALESCTIVDDISGVPWEEARAIASQCVMQLIHERWNPRTGTVYSTLSSDLRLKWDSIDETERDGVRKVFDRFDPSPLESLLCAKASPRWHEIPIDADVAVSNVYRLLLALARDPEFLVADRLAAWAIDMATVALALWGSIWCDRYRSIGDFNAPEPCFVRAFESLFFVEAHEEDLVDALQMAMAQIASDWPPKSVEALKAASSWYRQELRLRGIDGLEIWNIAQRCADVHPIRYCGYPNV